MRPNIFRKDYDSVILIVGVGRSGLGGCRMTTIYGQGFVRAQAKESVAERADSLRAAIQKYQHSRMNA